ncbi:MAG: hypothetical protein AABY16_03220 [Nanoarchaeota archaeon]
MDKIHILALQKINKKPTDLVILKRQGIIWLIILTIIFISGLIVPFYLLQKIGSAAWVFFYPPIIYLMYLLYKQIKEI